MVSPLWITGLIAAVFSPFDAHKKLNATMVGKQWQYLKKTNVSWVFVAGTTGESVSMTLDERKQLAEAWVATDANVIVHVGADCVQDAQALAKHAESIGARAIGAMPPSYFKPATVQALAITLAAICEAAPTLPCYYYHIPSMNSVDFPMIDLVEAMETLSNGQNFCGIKYTGLDSTVSGYRDALQVINYSGGKYEVLAGREEMILQSLSIGIRGHVGSQFNFLGDLYAEIETQFLTHGLVADNALKLQSLQLLGVQALASQQIDGLSDSMNQHKAFMRYAGVDVGDARLPYLPMTSEADAATLASFNSFCAYALTNFSSLIAPLAMCRHA